MLFQTPLFLSFFAGVFLSLLVLPTPRLRQGFLLIGSYAFYASWDWRFLFLIVLSTAIDFLVGLGLSRVDAPRRCLVSLSVAANLGILGIFKYYDFFAQSAADLALRFGAELHPTMLDVVLPVGISFYTFQSMSYTIDVFRGTNPVERSPLRFALYVAFFPQLVAGPIVRAQQFLPQLRGGCRPRARDFAPGALLFAVGLFKKIAISDHLARLSDRVFAEHATLDSTFVWLGVTCYAFQIYMDFSGYSDMAVGAGRMLGFRIPRNFRLPYRACSPSDFWRRWHISLSTWLRDYLFIPLGGSRGSPLRTTRNLMITMLLGGLWHGASWNFLLWGGWHGIWLGISRYLERLPQAVSWVLTLLAVWVGWVLFRAENLEHAWAMLTHGITGAPLVLPPEDLPLTSALLALGISILGHSRLGSVVEAYVRRRSHPTRAALAGALGIAAFVLSPGTTRPFIYFQF